MNIALWVVQGILAAVFAVSGSLKAVRDRETLIASGQTGIAVYPMPVVRFTAACELLAAVGLILPWATGILPVLTPVAAIGLCAVMVGAMFAHTKLHEPRNVAVNVLIFAACVFVAAGRFAGLD